MLASFLAEMLKSTSRRQRVAISGQYGFVPTKVYPTKLCLAPFRLEWCYRALPSRRRIEALT